jgi:hypothetical protein
LAAAGICLTIKPNAGSPGIAETSVKVHRNGIVLAILMATGTFTFLLALARRERRAGSFPYSRPRDGDREGEFELFIGS